MKLWTGRLDGNMDEWAVILNHSLPIDQRMAQEDVQASLGWAQSIFQAGILTQDEFDLITSGLHAIAEQFRNDTFEFVPGDEDIHTAVERKLTEMIGEAGEKLHTGRSRNDQVATDFRLWTMKAISNITAAIQSLQQTLIYRAEADFEIIIPGYTHLQQAQPILLSHWWLSHLWALQRDSERFIQLIGRTAVLPLGSAALAGTGFPIDRTALAQQLGFLNASPNSLDAVSDRDFAVEFLFMASLTATHLSRLAEMLILFSTQEFGLVVLSDAFSTGSSIMPQKKNPDPLELIRGKCGILQGKLMALMTTLKGLPSAYDKDLQEDKELVFSAKDTLEVLLKVMAGVIKTLEIDENRAAHMIHPYMMSTDIADELVKRGMPFRKAHHAVAAVVKKTETLQTTFEKLPLSEWQQISPKFDTWVLEILSPAQSVSRHTAWGGTAPEAVRQQLAHAKSIVLNNE